MPIDQFTDRMRALVAVVKSSALATGYDEILVAGDPEWRMEEQRKRDGIPISDGVWQNLTEAARKLNVALPDFIPPTP
jgi:LDH2 family malate/lactate/ureidoglycolate dehydrogenase